ncbi:MAG TPA: MarR family winged helix-turn-helix transcriptional regulator [Gaiellaceae bacterium]|jgi:DNA-binding MarR family transcriptional regulator
MSQVTPPHVSPPAVEAWTNLLRAHAATSRSLSAELQAGHGLSLNGYEALHELSQAPEGRMRRIDLARRLGLTPSGVTRLLEGLESDGLVARSECASDLRVTYAELTDAGRAKLADASCGHVGSVRAVLEEHLAPEEIETLAALLGKLPGP